MAPRPPSVPGGHPPPRRGTTAPPRRRAGPGSAIGRRCSVIEPHLRAVLRVELPELDEDRATGRRARRVPRLRRVANVGAGREIALLVLEHAVEYQELLAAAMGVGGEAAIRGIAHDAGGAGDLAADPVEHAAVHAGRRRGLPGQRSRVDRRPPGKVRVQVHRSCSAASRPRWRRPSTRRSWLIVLAGMVLHNVVRTTFRKLFIDPRCIGSRRVFGRGARGGSGNGGR